MHFARTPEALKKLAESLGLSEGLDGWARLAAEAGDEAQQGGA
jgi:hypothetical protein